jgi:uncharacterized protein
LKSPIANQLVEDMRTAMREGDAERRDVIRYLRSALGNREIELQRELTDEDVLGVIRTQIKQSTDAAEIFRNADRVDLASKEESQVAILRSYLPAQLSDDQLIDTTRKLIAELGAAGPGDMGKLMPRLVAEVGDRAEGRRVSQIARQELVRVDESTQ